MTKSLCRFADEGNHVLYTSREFKRVIPLFHTGPDSHELPRIDKYLDSCLNHTQFAKILTDSHSPQSVLAIRRSMGIPLKSFELFKTLATNSPIRKIVRDSYQIPKGFLDIVTES